MTMIRSYLLLACLLTASILSSQDTEIQGLILDAKTKEALPFASVQIKGTLSGTVSGPDGKFDLTLPAAYDTLVISFLGYENSEISIKKEGRKPKILLKPWQFVLTEVIVRPKSPEEYIKAAVEQYADNFASEPFISRAYFGEEGTMKNYKGYSYKRSEAVFTTYYEEFRDTAKVPQNRLDLYAVDQDGDFRSILEDNDRINEEGEEENFEMELPFDDGPGLTLQVAKQVITQPFMQEKNFKKYRYSFDDPSFYNDRELVVINFKSKRRTNFSKFNGKLYLDLSSLAIVAIDYDIDVKVPWVINTMLRGLVGLRFKDVQMDIQVRNQVLDEVWYPKEVIGGLRFNIKQKREVEELSFRQVFSVSSIETSDVKPIDKAHRFSNEKAPEEQIHNVDGLDWNAVNKVDMKTSK
jgi:hypothetical protein